jgi:hypothetical protein
MASVCSSHPAVETLNRRSQVCPGMKNPSRTLIEMPILCEVSAKGLHSEETILPRSPFRPYRIFVWHSSPVPFQLCFRFVRSTRCKVHLKGTFLCNERRFLPTLIFSDIPAPCSAQCSRICVLQMRTGPNILWLFCKIDVVASEFDL